MMYRSASPPSPRKGMGFRMAEQVGVIPALSLTQPWAELILRGKDVENRTWPTNYRGPLWLHAAKTMRREDYYGALALARDIHPMRFGLPADELPRLKSIVRSAIVGITWVVGCAENLDPAACLPDHKTNPWAFVRQYGWQLDLTRTWRLSEPLPATGALGLWRLTDAETTECLRRLPNRSVNALAQWEQTREP